MAQVPIRAPTASRMKIAPIPELTLAIAASRSDSVEWPRRQPMKATIIVATVSATWLGPLAPASPNRTYESATSPIRLKTAIRASVSVSGWGLSGLLTRDSCHRLTGVDQKSTASRMIGQVMQ